jgi:hypothetical protein
MLTPLLFFRNRKYAKIVALVTQPAAPAACSATSSRVSSRGRTIRQKVNFESLPHCSKRYCSELPERAPIERRKRLENLGAVEYFTNESDDRGDGGHDFEAEAQLLTAAPLLTAAGRTRDAPSTSVHCSTSSKEGSAAPVRRAPTPRLEIPNAVTGNPKFKRGQELLRPQQRHHHAKSVLPREPVVSKVDARTAGPSLELRQFSFIITNVSRCQSSLAVHSLRLAVCIYSYLYLKEFYPAKTLLTYTRGSSIARAHRRKFWLRALLPSACLLGLQVKL